MPLNKETKSIYRHSSETRLKFKPVGAFLDKL